MMVTPKRTLGRVIGDRRVRVLACLSAIVVGAGLIAGCGGDDEEEPTGEAEQAQEQPEEPSAGQPDGAEEPGAGSEQAEGNPSAGEQVFADNCATCHGDDGGGTGQAPTLQRPELAENPDVVEQQVRNGGGGMPPFEGQLSDQEIADVTAYVVQEIASE